jgi:uncharacterized protein (DUF488 family)
LAKARALFTIGYEGLSVDDFVALLQRARVISLLDIRELPLSRRPGFSKRALACALEEAGITYEHLPLLGCPKAIRHRYRDDADWASYSRAFRSYLKTQDDAVGKLVEHANRTTSCLLCFEADFNYCHRSIVARAAARAGGPEIRHITPKGVIPDVLTQVAA